MFKSNSSTFFRRIKLYGFGLALGLVLSYGFFHDRYPTWLPGSLVLEGLINSEMTYTDQAICLMECGNISKAGIKEVILNGSVDFSESETHRKPCPSYIIEGETEDGQSLELIVVKCDSTSEVLSVKDINKNLDCSCK